MSTVEYRLGNVKVGAGKSLSAAVYPGLASVQKILVPGPDKYLYPLIKIPVPLTRKKIAIVGRGDFGQLSTVLINPISSIQPHRQITADST